MLHRIAYITWHRLTDTVVDATILFTMFVLMFGCAGKPKQKIDAINLNRGLAWGTTFWKLEASGRFNDPILISCHGGYRHFQWHMFPDHQDPIPVWMVARVMGQMYPNRDIVLITCNERGHTLHGPSNVWYAKTDVLASPHFGLPILYRFGPVGSANRFVRASP